MQPAGTNESAVRYRANGASSIRWLKRLALIAGCVVLATAAGIATSNVWLDHSAHARTYAELGSVPSRTVAIVPGSRVTNGRPLSILRDRLEAALALYQQGRVHAILVSGDDTPAAPEVSVMRGWLRARGVPAADIWTDEGGSRTRETMNRAAALYDVRDAVVCTQTVNMARTLFLARAAGIDAVGVALPTHLSQSRRYMAVEALKTTLAVVESAVRSGPELLAGERARRAAIASR